MVSISLHIFFSRLNKRPGPGPGFVVYVSDLCSKWPFVRVRANAPLRCFSTHTHTHTYNMHNFILRGDIAARFYQIPAAILHVLHRLIYKGIEY